MLHIRNTAARHINLPQINMASSILQATSTWQEDTADAYRTEVDGDAKEVWPKTAAWFLGPKVLDNFLHAFLNASNVFLFLGRE